MILLCDSTFTFCNTVETVKTLLGKTENEEMNYYDQIMY